MTADLEKLRKRSTQDSRRIRLFENETAHLQLRLKDRDEELRGKAKLLEVCCSLPSFLGVLTSVADTTSGFPRRAGIVEPSTEYG